MSNPSPSESPQGRPVTLDKILSDYYRIKSKPPSDGPTSKKSAATPSRACRIAALVVITIFLSISAFAIYCLSIKSSGLALLILSGIIDAGLYIHGFLSAYAYEKGLSKVVPRSIRWRELIPGVIYFGFAWAIAWTLHIAYTGFTAILLFWAFGFLTSPGLSKTRTASILTLTGKLVKTFAFKKA